MFAAQIKELLQLLGRIATALEALASEAQRRVKETAK